MSTPTPNVSVNVNIGTSEAVDALVHRYIEARQAELAEAKKRARQAEWDLDMALTRIGESFTDGTIGGRLRDFAAKLLDLPNTGTMECLVQVDAGGNAVLSIEHRDRCGSTRSRAMEIPLDIDVTLTHPAEWAEVERLNVAHKSAENVVADLLARIERDGGPVKLRGEMLARLVEAQAPDLSATIASIVGGSRLLPERS